jgi:Ca2+/Na+ antiporter
MANSRPEKIVNLLSALLVLVVGFYVIIFLPINISPAARVLIGLLLIVYFLFRMVHYSRRYKRPDRLKDRD